MTCRPKEIARPASLAELQNLLRRDTDRIRVVGAGHSFTPLVATDEVLINLDQMSGVTTVDSTHNEATVWGGTRLKNLNDALFEHGVALENLGDIDSQSIAGAVSTGTHGCGAQLGNLSTQVTGLTLVLASGEVLECDERTNADVFKAAQISLGSLGVIARLRIRVLPAYRLKLQRKTLAFGAALAEVDSLKSQHRHFEFFWFPYADLVATKALDVDSRPPTLTDRRPLLAGVSRFVNDVVMENGAFWVLCAASRSIPALIPGVNRLAASLASEGTSADSSHRIFATRRLVRFHEMEYAVPSERGPDCLRELRDYVRNEKIAVNFPVEYRYVCGDNIWLSPAYQRDSAYIAVHMFQPMSYKGYFDAAEAIFRNHRGRPHWGKMHQCSASRLAELYPEWRRFHEVRRQLDPRGRFLNGYLRQLFAAEPNAEKENVVA